MTDDLDDRLRDAKLAALAEFAAGAGHEINNPVATILGRAQQLLRHEDDPNRRRALATIASQALRIRDMIGDLMLFARPPEAEPVWVDLASLVQRISEPLHELAAERGITLRLDAPRPVQAFADPEQMAVAVVALIENAINATPADGTVVIAVSDRDGRSEISVEDHGVGFTDTDREHAFDPFYSGRQAGRGLGFGLPKAWRIATLAGGSITIDSRDGTTVARISLPVPKTAGDEPAVPAKPSRRKRS
ncbi:MAG: HAMP domain-containing histidine kinase [Planctomycetota bacterium]|nr:HAMP domain-containing histidine kinase [Planctomycetaceae bacterium]MDQ3331340.1 HAMP domain-containing histidine kinase [Planctomycetota bacterium]